MSVIWEKKQSSNGLLMCFACAVIPRNTLPAPQKMRNEILRERESFNMVDFSISLLCNGRVVLTKEHVHIRITRRPSLLLPPHERGRSLASGCEAQQGEAGRTPRGPGLPLPYCRLLSRSDTPTVACSNAPMQKHINTCGWCEWPPVRCGDARTHVVAIKTAEDQVAACSHKSTWSTAMCVTCALLHQHTHTHRVLCV